MADLLFADAELAALYDRLNPGRDDFDFYLPMIMAAGSVLDVGCGTGSLLHEARTAGHRGHLCGLDPAPGMIAQARKHADIEWVLGDLTSVDWKAKFDFIIMTGHAFQVFIEDEDLRAALIAVRAALSDGGRFAFETRNPAARAWEAWDTEARGAMAVAMPSGGNVKIARRITVPFDGRVVSFCHIFQSDAWDAPRVSHSTLRFLDRAELAAALTDTGLMVEAQYGDWDRSALTEASPEIITICRRA